MTVFVVIAIIVFIIWIYVNNNSSSSSNSSNSSNSTNSTNSSNSETSKSNYSPTTASTITAQVSSVKDTITVLPTKIKSTPELKISLIDGEYRYFQNYYINGTQYTFGFPKENCTDRRVWVGIENEEIERISYSEAMRRIRNTNKISSQSKYLNERYSSSSIVIGYCSICNKKLRGNIYKNKCYECYTNETTSISRVGYCKNCNKKLRGNIYKTYCTECYHNGHR